MTEKMLTGTQRIKSNKQKSLSKHSFRNTIRVSNCLDFMSWLSHCQKKLKVLEHWFYCSVFLFQILVATQEVSGRVILAFVYFHSLFPSFMPIVVSLVVWWCTLMYFGNLFYKQYAPRSDYALRGNLLWLRPNEKISVLRVTRPYLNLMMKPRIFSGFLEKV